MLDTHQALGLLSSALAELEEAKATLDTIEKEDGEVRKLRAKRNAVKEALEKVGASLARLQRLVAATAAPPRPHPTPPGPVPTPPEPPAPGGDLFSMEDQLAVSRLMQDSKVHLAVRRRHNFWEIRHRNTPDGEPSDPIRAQTIAECYAIYERQAVRASDFEPFEGRPLSPEEQQALADMREMPIDNPRSVRWEDGMTEVDYIDKSKQPAGGRHDDVRFPAGELIDPIRFMKTVLG